MLRTIPGIYQVYVFPFVDLTPTYVFHEREQFAHSGYKYPLSRAPIIARTDQYLTYWGLLRTSELFGVYLDLVGFYPRVRRKPSIVEGGRSPEQHVVVVRGEHRRRAERYRCRQDNDADGPTLWTGRTMVRREKWRACHTCGVGDSSFGRRYTRRGVAKETHSMIGLHIVRSIFRSPLFSPDGNFATEKLPQHS